MPLFDSSRIVSPLAVQALGARGASRRSVLQGGLALGGLVGLGGLAGCDSSTGGSTESSGNATKAPTKRGGTLRVGVAGGSAKDSIDAHRLASDPDIARLFQLYDPLAIKDANFRLQMRLAESIEAGATADVWTIKLKSGLTFHDGKPVTADDVIFSIKRIVDPKDPKTGKDSLADVDVSQLKKLDNLTVRVKLKNANVTFPESIGDYYNAIVPVGYNPSKPVGTGPFKFQSFTPGEQSVFTRNDNYWDAGKPYVDKLVIIDMPDEAARVNALLGGQVDMITTVPPSQVNVLKTNPAVQLVVAEGVRWQPFTMRVDVAPFNDVRVRQAMRLIVDRPQMIKQALGGQGVVANDIYAPFDASYNKTLPQRVADPAQAKSLLAKAGKSGLTVGLVTADIAVGSVESAQVFAEQAKAAGVKIKLRKVQPNVLFGDQYLKWPFSQDAWGMRNFIAQTAVGSLPGSPFNETHWADPEFQSLVTQAKRALDEGKRTELIHAAQKIEWERGGLLIWSFNNSIDAQSAKVTGLVPSKTGLPLGAYSFKDVGFVE